MINELMEYEHEGIIVSRNWDCIMPFSEMIDKAKFIFSHQGGGRERIKIVINGDIEGYDCFEIGNDRYGIIVSASAIFGNNWGGMIDDSSKEIIPFIKKYIIKTGATDLIKY